MPSTIKIGIVDNHSLYRKVLTDYLLEKANLQVLVQASDIYELLDLLKKYYIDILLVDLFTPKPGGNEALKILRSEYPGLKILVHSVGTDVGLISSLLDEGIHGYVPKSAEPGELLQAIRSISSNGIYRNEVLTEAFYYSRQNGVDKRGKPQIVELTDREKKILQMLWEEKSNKEIARQLFLGVRSIEKMRQNLKEKLRVRSTVGLLKYAIDEKIIEISTTNRY